MPWLLIIMITVATQTGVEMKVQYITFETEALCRKDAKTARAAQKLDPGPNVENIWAECRKDYPNG